MALGTVARVFGIIYLVVGVLGFVPALAQASGDPHVVIGTTAYLLGLFPVNILHNAVHVVIGLAGLAMGASTRGALAYLRALAVIYALLAVLGLIPLTNTLFGLVPIGGNDIWLHAVTAILAAYFGWRVTTSETAA